MPRDGRIRTDQMTAAEKLRYLATFGLYPGVELSISRKEPYGGIMWIRINTFEQPISLEVASEIYVEPVLV